MLFNFFSYVLCGATIQLRARASFELYFKGKTHREAEREREIEKHTYDTSFIEFDLLRFIFGQKQSKLATVTVLNDLSLENVIAITLTI